MTLPILACSPARRMEHVLYPDSGLVRCGEESRGEHDVLDVGSC